MNKGFLVVFLGIILGAMALIFVNQASAPTGGTGTYQVASGESGNAGETAGQPETVASNGTTGTSLTPAVPVAPTPPATAPAKPEPATPATPVTPPAPQKPEPAKPDVSTPGTATPEPVKPEPATPVTPPAPPKPEPTKPDVSAPETATPEPVKPEPVKPEPAKPETPSETANMTPVTSTPETLAKPGGGQTRKSLTLVNIGLNFKGNGMALRIEADAPFSYKTFALPSPDRYVVDLVGTWNKMRAPSVPANNMIKGARAGKQAGGPRLVLDMQRSPKKHSVTWVTPTVLEIVIE